MAQTPMPQPQPQPLQETKRGRAKSKAKKKETEPWEFSDSEGEVSEGDDDEETFCLPGKKLKEMTEFLPAPFIDKSVNLHTEFPKRILHQPIATHHLANFVRGLRLHVRDRSRSGTGLHVGDRIHRYILSGPSGVGKTESVEMVRHWLGMDPGWLYEKQFIYVDGSVLKESTQTTRIIGAGAGYIGHESKSCLVHEMLDAVVPAEEAILLRLNRSTKLYRRKHAEYRKRRKSGVALEPPFILLFLDEIDKVHPDVITTLNGFLETGEIKSSQGRRFVLPQATELIVFFTSNYGDDQIAQLKFHDCSKGVAFVEAAMKRHGLAQCSISRFGTHLIYFPISEVRMMGIIRTRLASFMKTKRLLTTKYGDIDYEEALECVAQFIRQLTRDTKSVREGLKHMFNSLDPLLQDAFFRLEGADFDTVWQGVQAKLTVDDRALKLFQKSFQLEALETEAPTTAIVQSIQSNPVNTANLEIYRNESPHSMIQAFGVSHGDQIINCMIVPFIVTQCTIKHYDSVQTREVITDLRTELAEIKQDYRELRSDYKELKEDNRELRRNYRAFASTIATITDEHALEPLRQMASEKLETLGQSDESSEDERPPRRKRRPLSLLDSDKREKRVKLIEPAPALEVAMPVVPAPLVEEAVAVVPEEMVLVPEEPALIPEEMVIVPKESALVLMDDLPLFGVANIAEMGAVDGGELEQSNSGEEVGLDETAMKICAKCGQAKSLFHFSRARKYTLKKTNTIAQHKVIVNTCRACRR